MDNALLRFENVQIRFGETEALRGVNFSLLPNTITALVGASGSGKSLTSLATMGLLTKNAKISGKILFQNHNLLQNDAKHWQQIRGNVIAMIFQEPMSALNPVMKCGKQLTECVLAHKEISNAAAKALALEWLSKVKLPDPDQIFLRYPHQLSGGQKQRLMIAMAMINGPKLLIADEPTTALDVLVQRSIVLLMKELQEDTGTAVLFITHDIALAKLIAPTILEMKAGVIVPHTLARFPLPERTSAVDRSQQPLLEVENICVIFNQNNKQTLAVNDASLQIYAGETVGLVGASGCGKTTLSRAILGLLPVSKGKINFLNKNITENSAKEWRQLRMELQIIYQDPYASLNPRMRIGEAIAEPLLIQGHMKKEAVKAEVVKLLEQVQLPAESYSKYPHEFSGGQRQRICIARAVIMKPQLIICDESVAALDIFVQQQILTLLQQLQQDYGIAYLFITHDLNVVKQISDRILVMKDGKIVEQGNARELIAHPKTAYTQELIDAIP